MLKYMTLFYHYRGISADDSLDESVLLTKYKGLSEEDRDILTLYHHCFDDDKVDIDLVFSLIQKINAGKQEGEQIHGQSFNCYSEIELEWGNSFPCVKIVSCSDDNKILYLKMGIY